MTNDYSKAAKAAGAWWAERLQQGDKVAFAEYIENAVEDQLIKYQGRCVTLECDYDPQGILLDAVNSLGIECRGFMFSAQDILPQKHSLDVFPDKLEPKEGYGNWTDVIHL